MLHICCSKVELENKVIVVILDKSQYLSSAAQRKITPVRSRWVMYKR